MTEHLTLQTPRQRGWPARPGPEGGHLERPLISGPGDGGNINNSFHIPTNFTFTRLISSIYRFIFFFQALSPSSSPNLPVFRLKHPNPNQVPKRGIWMGDNTGFESYRICHFQVQFLAFITWSRFLIQGSILLNADVTPGGDNIYQCVAIRRAL